MYKKVCRTCLLHLLLSWCSRCRRRRRIFRSRSSPEINCFFRNIRKWEKWLLSFFPINLSDLPKIAKLRWMNRVWYVVIRCHSFECYLRPVAAISNLAQTSFIQGAFLWDDPDLDQWSEITRIMVDQTNRWIHCGQGFICSELDLPYSEWSWITLIVIIPNERTL